ncbi:MAG: hypothetical protein V1891_04565 [bacterium]
MEGVKMVIKILVADDTEKELQTAKNIAKNKLVNVEADYVETSLDAKQGIKTGKYHGVLSDVFFDGELRGIEIAKYSLKQRIPVVLITDTYHHGKSQPVCTWSRDESLVTLLDNEFSEDRKNKNWLTGFLALLWAIKLSPKITDEKIENGYIFEHAGCCFREFSKGEKALIECSTCNHDKNAFISMVKNHVKL